MRAIWIALVCAVVVTASFVALSYALTFVPKEYYRARTAEALASGDLPASFPAWNTRQFARPRYNGNDCDIMSMVQSTAPGTRFQDAVSPAIPLRNDPNVDACQLMVAQAHGHVVPMGRYHNYIFGFVAATAALMTVLSYGRAMALIYVFEVLLAGALGAVGLSRFMHQQHARDAAYGALGFGVLLFGGIHSFGWSPSFNFSDATVLLYLIDRYLLPGGNPTIRAGLFGAFTAGFEFLTGAVQIGFIIIIFCELFDGFDLTKLRRSLGAYSLAFVGSFIMKAALVYFAFGGQPVGTGGAELAHWIGITAWSVDPSNAATLQHFHASGMLLKSNRLLAGGYAFAKLIYNAPYITFGSIELGILLMVVLPGGIALWSLAQGYRRPYCRAMYLAAAAPCLLIYSWPFVFVSHTIIHASFMDRMLAWLGIASFAAFIYLLLAEQADQRSSKQ